MEEIATRGWSDDRCDWGIVFKAATKAVSRLVNSLRLEEVRWSEVNIRAMVVKSDRGSAGSDEAEEHETRASIKGTKKGRVGEVEGSSICSSSMLFLAPPQTAKRVFTNPRSFANW